MDCNKSLLVANWKMHKTIEATKDFVRTMLNFPPADNVVICPAFTLQAYVKELPFSLGGQDCSEFSTTEGAFTGEVSAMMLEDAGCKYVIIGHSERRKYHQETASIIRKKIANAHQAGLIAVACIGEDLNQREAGNYLQFLAAELEAILPDSANMDNTIIAYEPIWAIGTGRAASLEQIEEVHQFLTDKFKIIYGGSVTQDNAGAILSTKNVAGLLIGGASLDANKFNQIIKIRGQLCN